MKKRILAAIFVLSFVCAIPPSGKGQADLYAGLSKRVIKAIDLQIQRFQNGTIKLQNAQQALQNLLSKLKLDEITGWATKQKQLFQTFYDELWKVKAAISLYRQGKEIIQKQIDLMAEYKRAYALFKRDPNFSADELHYMEGVYNGIISESINNLDQLQLVLSAFTVQMDDAKRLKIMEHAGDEIGRNLTDLKRFNNSNVIVSLQRTKDQAELQQVKLYYGLLH